MSNTVTTQPRFIALPLHRRTILSSSHVCGSAITCSLLILIYYISNHPPCAKSMQSGAEESVTIKPPAHPTTY